MGDNGYRMHNTLLPNDVKTRVAAGDLNWDGFRLTFFLKKSMFERHFEVWSNSVTSLVLTRSQAYAVTSVLLWKCHLCWKDAFTQKCRIAWVIGSGGFLNMWIIHMLIAHDAMLAYDSEWWMMHQAIDAWLHCVCLWIHWTGLLFGWPQKVPRTVNLFYFRLSVKWS